MKHTRRFLVFAYTILPMFFIHLNAHAAEQYAAHQKYISVSPSGHYASLKDALKNAKDGDIIKVFPGTYHGNIVVSKRVRITGKNYPVLDGNGTGTVVTIAAPHVVFEGFAVRNSGDEPDSSDSGITVSSPDVTVENNKLEEVLFGIFLQKADRALVKNNFITGKKKYEQGRKGDGIKIWYTKNAHIENNVITNTRDVVIWYSPDAAVQNNTISDGRYGIHLMFCDNIRLMRNKLLRNYVGIFVMYSTDVDIEKNLVRDQHGPSGYALGFKEADNVTVKENYLINNRAGAFLDSIPYRPDTFSHFEKNIFAFNDAGIIFLPSAFRNTFTGNTFWENTEQVGIEGGGQPPQNRWEGNTWSDYAGFDLNNDGKGDMPYIQERFFENLTDRNPALAVLNHSPVAQAIELTTSAFPVVRPQPKLTDAAPRTLPLPVPLFISAAKKNGKNMSMASAFLMGITGIGLLLGLSQKTEEKTRGNKNKTKDALHSVHVRTVSKAYGNVKALTAVSFNVQQGEAIALWGANGAGKTTLLKVLLGIIPFEGTVEINGWNVKSHEKNARKNIGYVPQEFAYHEWSVRETMEFYCQIKKVSFGEIQPSLETAGLSGYSHFSVSALSGGLKQRLALALALLGNPPVLLLDEPTANLDVKMRHDYLMLLKDLKKSHNKTLLFASHRSKEVQTLADRVLILERGNLTGIVTPEVLEHKLNPGVFITFYIPNEQKNKAVEIFKSNGVAASMNGNGAVIAEVSRKEKMRAVMLLVQNGIQPVDMELNNSDNS